MKPSKQDTDSMARLLELLTQSLAFGGPTEQDIPVAAGVFDSSGNLVTWAVNQRESTGDPTAHAEVVALRQASELVNDGWRLSDCTLVVTLEPCAMCAGAALNARVARVIFGANEPKSGAVGSVVDLLRDPRNIHKPEVVGGVLADECSQVLRGWFARLRDTKDVLTNG